MMCKALFAARSPPRFNRCRVTFPTVGRHGAHAAKGGKASLGLDAIGIVTRRQEQLCG